MDLFTDLLNIQCEHCCNGINEYYAYAGNDLIAQSTDLKDSGSQIGQFYIEKIEGIEKEGLNEED